MNKSPVDVDTLLEEMIKVYYFMLLLNPTNQSNSKNRILEELENDIQFYFEIKTLFE
ncbi:34938_t:CDS:2, partial [Gigaspora margarita]